MDYIGLIPSLKSVSPYVQLLVTRRFCWDIIWVLDLFLNIMAIVIS